jgi:hypothetical protein
VDIHLRELIKVIGSGARRPSMLGVEAEPAKRFKALAAGCVGSEADEVERAQLRASAPQGMAGP